MDFENWLKPLKHPMMSFNTAVTIIGRSDKFDGDEIRHDENYRQSNSSAFDFYLGNIALPLGCRLYSDHPKMVLS